MNYRTEFADRLLIASSVLYLVMPVIIFFWGWLHFYIAFPLSLIFIAFSFVLYKELASEPTAIIKKENALFWVILILCLCIWVFFSGMGSFSYQTKDFIIRNPMYRDLCNYDWPVIYDMSAQNETIQQVMGNGTMTTSYYFSWWLFPAMVSKILSAGETVNNICLYIWALFGVFLTSYNLCRYFRKTVFVIPAVFIFFSGLDIIGALIDYALSAEPVFDGSSLIMDILFKHMEWYAHLFQYSGLTTQLYWVFNQSVPLWLIVILLLQLKGNRNKLALSSLSFAFSPWAAIGIIPLALASVYGRKWRNAFSLQNFLVPLAMLVIYGAFYLMGSGTESKATAGWNINSIEDTAVYLMFIFLEFAAYFMIMGSTASKYSFYYIVLAELLILPVYNLISLDFVMRASIPALFILMTFIIKFLTETKAGIRRKILIAAMIIAAVTPLNEMNRSIVYTSIHFLNEHGLLPASLAGFDKGSMLRREDIYSFADIKTPIDSNEVDLEGMKDYFFVIDYENTFFARHLMK